MAFADPGRTATFDPPHAPGSPGRASDALTTSLLSRRMIAYVWAPIAVIGLLHYGLGTHHHWAHDVLRRAYYLPIIVAAFLVGLRGGLATAVVASVTYLPHAFFLEHRPDPAAGVEKFLEIVLYFGVGGVAGYLADLESKRKTQLQSAHDHLQSALEEQRRLTQQLARAGRLSALGELVAGIAHEIKNPLHALQGTAEIVDSFVPADAEERRLWELHVAEIERLRRTAERFLSFAKPRPLEMATLDLRDVTERLYRLVGAEARQKSVEISFDTPGTPVGVQGDRDQLAQVGMNIVINGIKALGEHGGHMRISVGSSKEPGHPRCYMRIENDGPPIPDDLLEQIFDPFHSTDADGTGLGLAISARIIEQHDGFIEAANDGLGVSFTVYLPCA